jgi:serine/threonine protein kinase
MNAPRDPNTTTDPASVAAGGNASQADADERRDPNTTTDARSVATGGEAPQVDSLAFLTPSAQPGSLGRIGHYEVLGVIGRGAMGAVLKAQDEKLQRLVALKVMSAALRGDPAARKRFVREARLAAAVTHDHIVAIYAVEEEGPVPYLVMPLIAGHSLQEEIDTRGPLPTAEVVRIGMQIAEGLEAAHRHELIHRDIKPANILLEDGSGRVKITDFGLARAGDDASITQSGQILGTPMYMSPEQAEGKKIDPRSDLFSLGSVLYTLCTGRPPFRAKSTVAVLRRVCDSEPRLVREINPDVPGWLEKVILKLLEKHPADRYQTAGKVAAVLRDHLTEGSQLSQPAAPRTEKLKPRARKDTMIAAPAAPRWRKTPLILGGVLVLGLAGLLVAGTLATWIAYHWMRRTADNSVVKDDAAGKPEPGKEMPDKLVGSWKARGSGPLPLDLVLTFKKDGSYRQELFDPQGRSAGLVSTGRWQFRDGEILVFYDNGEFQRATVNWIDNDAMSYGMVERRPPGPLPTTQFHRDTAPINPKGPDDAQKENPGPFPPGPWGPPPFGGPSKVDLDAAEKRYREALDKNGPKHIDTLLARRDIAQLYLEVGRFDQVKPILLDVLDGMSDQPVGDEIRRFTIGILLQCPPYVGDPPPEYSVLRKYLPELRKALSDGSPALASTLAQIGSCLLRQKKYAEAEPVLRECLGIREKHLPNDWLAYNTRSALGGSLLGQEKYADAEPLLLAGYEGMKQRERLIPPQGKVRLVEALERLVQLYEATDKKDDAEKWRKELADTRAAQK